MRSPLAVRESSGSLLPFVDCSSDIHNDCPSSSPAIEGKRSYLRRYVLEKRLDRLQRLRRVSRCWHGIVGGENDDCIDGNTRNTTPTTPEDNAFGNEKVTDDGFIGFVVADLSHETDAVADIDSSQDQKEALTKSSRKISPKLGVRRKNIRNITKRMIASRETNRRVSILQRMQGSRVKTALGVLAVEGGVKLLSSQLSAVFTIQKVYRGHMVRKTFIGGISTVRRDQNVVRGVTSIRQASTVKLRNELAVIKLQTCYRGYMERMKYKSVVSDIVWRQRFTKRVFAKIAETRLETCHDLRRMEAAAMIIQAFYRNFRARKTIIHSESHANEVDSSETIKSNNQPTTESRASSAFLALHLQALYRGFKCRRQYFLLKSRIHDIRHVEACIVIQSYWRSFLCSRDFVLTVMDITTLQSLARRRLAGRKVRELKGGKFPSCHETQYTDSNETLGCSKCGLNSELEATLTTVGEDLSFCFMDVSLEEEMKEFQLSFEEEMSELQTSFEDEIAMMQRRIHQVARMDFW